MAAGTTAGFGHPLPRARRRREGAWIPVSGHENDGRLGAGMTAGETGVTASEVQATAGEAQATAG